MPRLLLWKQILLLLIVHYTVTTVSIGLEFLTGVDEAPFSTSAPSEAGSNDSGEQVIDLLNGEQSPETLLLSQSRGCKDDYGQAPNRRRHVRRQKNSACSPDYLNGPETVQTHKLPAKLQKGSIEQQQGRPEQKTPETPPFMEPASFPMFGELLVGPGPDPSICKNPDRPIPVCHSRVDAVYSSTLPWIADQLPNCHAIWIQLGGCQAPDVPWCCERIETVPSPTISFAERTIMVGFSCELLTSGAGPLQ